jgi:predicted ATPase/signal transduction histidine kinase/tRNA A-37 threonylcarbamoyl transferase component Bud32
MPANEPSRYPGYTGVEQIYLGARSTVYRARRIADDQRVILKIASAEHIALAEARARLDHELELLTAIRSDRVIRAHDVETLGGEAMLVLQDFGGVSLDGHLRRVRPSLAGALDLAIAVASALRDIHAAGIVHRDVAPTNIVYNAATGETRLIDFDIATVWRTDHRGFAPPATLEGTLSYMAPEQTGRMNRTTDSRADLYALGVTLFEMLAGRLPFVETDILAVVHAHLAVRPPALETIDPAIPRPVSATVMKLLAKAPEDRYQTAEGVLADLRRCAEELAATGQIADFALGRDDVGVRFELTQQLYGRDAERQVLAGAFERVSAGAVETVLVAGPSGIGKTSLVRELFPVITRQRGYFVSHKFEQLRGEAPYPALVAAFDQLIHHLLTESEDELARWREQITAALGHNSQVAIDAIPALERVIGTAAPAVALDAAGTQRRFQLTLQKLLQVFTRRAHPLVVFLDDLQWADPESIQLLKQVASSEATESFLLIEAFRDNEVSDSHPVMIAARELDKLGRVVRLDVRPLPTSEVAALVADALHRDVAEIEPLARLVCRKTDGNPFFVRQLLLALHDARHIVFDPIRRHFTFDAASIESAPISQNVADLLADNLRKLPLSTQRVLAVAAAAGGRFELELVAEITGLALSTVHRELGAALDHELVVPLTELEYVDSAAGSGLVFRSLRFQHDRIQRAAYALMTPEDQRRTHLRIGELVLAATPASELPERIFDVVSQLNRALALIDTPARKAQLAQLNAMAARKARGSAAYATAADCLRIALGFLDWRADYPEQLAAHMMLAECLYVGGNPGDALAVLDTASLHAASGYDRSALEALRATVHVHAQEFKAAIACTRRAAAELGTPLSDDPAVLGPAIATAISEILGRIGDREIEALVEIPRMADRDSLALMRVLDSCLAAAFQAEPLLGAFLIAHGVQLTLDRGSCSESSRAFGMFASLLHGTPLHHLAYQFGKLGVALNRRLDDRAGRAGVDFVFALFSAPWRRPLGEAIACLREAAQSGRELGDHVVAGGSAVMEIYYRVVRGAEPLAEIGRDAAIYRQQCRELGDPGTARAIGWSIDRLRVLTGELASMADDPANPQRTVDAVRDAGGPQQVMLSVSLVDTLYSTGDEASALALATANQALEATAPGILYVVEHQLFHGLAAAAVYRREPARRAELAQVIDAKLHELNRWATECPANFEAMAVLLEAERASLASDLGATLALYGRATESAMRSGFRRLEALANELHGRLWLDRGAPELARVYLVRAWKLYAALGAQRKVDQLERAHPVLARAARASSASSTVTTTTSSGLLDVTAIARATRAISSELELDKLLERMLDIILENAGADAGALVLDSPQGLVVAAERTAGARQISTAETPLGSAALPRSVVHYVHRTESVIVLDSAAADPRFSHDHHIQALGLHSVLCMPVKHKDRVIGVLYVENTLVSGAFTQARLEALTILVSQLAVSLENAALFAAQRVHLETISRANAELEQHRAHLEDLIAERTKELTHANQKLRDAAAERERMEAELRLAQKLESVGRLAAGVAHEINTPIQFVSDNITFVRDALPSLVDTLAIYRALATIAETVDHPALATAVAQARAAEAEAEIDYALANTPAALSGALDGLGRVAVIVRSMKEFAHPDRDEKSQIDLNRAIESTLMMAAHEYRYVAEVETALGELPLVRCNCGAINQAVLNLVINAAHAIRDVVGDTGAKGVIGVRTRADHDWVEIAISDTGTGIPEAIRDQIFDPFFTTKEVGRGTGQGLAIVHSVVVDKHGGSLRFETSAGAGTTFFLRLPIEAAA